MKKKPPTDEQQVTPSSGNVFADLDIPLPDELQAKAALANCICQVITQRGMTQADAAEVLGIDQPKVSALLRGQLKEFSAERLMRLLNKLGQDVEITVRAVAGHRQAETRIVVSS